MHPDDFSLFGIGGDGDPNHNDALLAPILQTYWGLWSSLRAVDFSTPRATPRMRANTKTTAKESTTMQSFIRLRRRRRASATGPSLPACVDVEALLLLGV
jgi:hypothetical protein